LPLVEAVAADGQAGQAREHRIDSPSPLITSQRDRPRPSATTERATEPRERQSRESDRAERATEPLTDRRPRWWSPGGPELAEPPRGGARPAAKSRMHGEGDKGDRVGSHCYRSTSTQETR
jgi:hypothetical protein